MRIFGQASSFEEGITGFKENLTVIAKLLGDKKELNETAVITLLLQKVFEERKMYQNGKEAREFEIIVKPSEIVYRFGGNVFGWSVFGDGSYEFFYGKNM